MQEKLYVKASGNCIVYDRQLRLGDAIKFECSNPAIKRRVKQLDFYSFNHEHAVVFSILKVIERIHMEYPDVDVVNCGEEDFIVEYVKDTAQSPWIERFKLLLISIIVFFGSAFTIMTFHNDIGIEAVFERFYMQLIGQQKPPVTELEISYSIGLGIGIVVFFNHIRRKKITKDLTPIEVEMQKYNEDLIMAKVAESEAKGHKEDVS